MAKAKKTKQYLTPRKITFGIIGILFWVFFQLISDRVAGWGNQIIDQWLSAHSKTIFAWILKNPANLMSALAILLIMIMVVDWYRFTKRQNNDTKKKNSIPRGTTRSKVSVHPIIRVRDYGMEKKPMYKTALTTSGLLERITTNYDTLFIQVFNAHKYKDAKKVYSKVEWMDMNGSVFRSHYGRWHKANPEKEAEPENLLYVDLNSNGHSEKLHFACLNKTREEKFFYGLARENVIQESWDNPEYKLDGEQYIVKITLFGNYGVKQEFKYGVKNDKGNLFIEKALTKESERYTPKSKEK